MKNTLNYSEAPTGFALCSSAVCGKADSCLRRLAFEAVPHDTSFLHMVNPYLSEQSPQGCKHFVEARKERYAKGFMQLARALPVGVAPTFRNSLIGAFGRKKYYQYRKGDTLIPPEAQARIVALAARLGVQMENSFDAYEERYTWRTR